MRHKHLLFIVYAVAATLGGPGWIHVLLDAIMSPVVLVVVAYRFTSENYKTGEYFALLFTRPLRRVDYVVSKAVAGWLGTQLFVYKFVFFFLVTETIFGVSPMVLPTGWDFLNLAVNAFSASCLSMLLCKRQRHRQTR